jgi:hypothetical protein
MSKKIESYSQCHFIRPHEGGGTVETTAHIDTKEAKVGARMTFKGVEGIWTITRAGQPGPRPHHGINMM